MVALDWWDTPNIILQLENFPRYYGGDGTISRSVIYFQYTSVEYTWWRKISLEHTIKYMVVLISSVTSISMVKQFHMSLLWT